MYRETHKKYSNSDYQYAHPFNYTGRYCRNLDPRIDASYTWNQGDAIAIPFSIPERYSDCNVIFTVYDLNHSPLFTVTTTIDEDCVAYLEFSEETSSQIQKGSYYCSASVSKHVDPFKEGDEVIAIVVPMNSCILRVV